MRILVLIALAACTVDRKSETIACKTTADCTLSNHVCDDGYCVKQSDSGCPDHCDTCNTNATPKTCTVSNTGGDSFDCPSGFACVLDCGAAGNSKCGTITCHNDAQCVIACSGANSCGDITCSDSCACDVTCTAGACQGKAISCPRDGASYCTPDQTNGPACTSESGGRCNSC